MPKAPVLKKHVSMFQTPLTVRINPDCDCCRPCAHRRLDFGDSPFAHWGDALVDDLPLTPRHSPTENIPPWLYEPVPYAEHVEADEKRKREHARLMREIHTWNAFGNGLEGRLRRRSRRVDTPVCHEQLDMTDFEQ